MTKKASLNWGQEWDTTEDVIVTFVNGQRVKFTLGVCSELAMGTYRSYLRQAQRFIDDEYSFERNGKKIAPGSLKTNAEIDELTDEQRALYDLGDITYDTLNKWAAIRASLRSVSLDVAAPPQEITDSAPIEVDAGEGIGDEDEAEVAEPSPAPTVDAEWVPTDLPSSWLDPQRFLENAPTRVVSALYQRVNALNPGIFSMWVSPTKKKIVQINVG